MSLRQPPPQAIVIFGASGDLAHRKIFPALYNLARDGLMPDRYAIVGYSRSDWSDTQFAAHVRSGIDEFSRTEVEDDVWKSFEANLAYVSGEFNSPGAMQHLTDDLVRADREVGAGGGRLYYCATPPAAFADVIARLGEIGPGPGARVVVEKPFGTDLESARRLNECIHAVFDESQVFRIDHYLGKETVQNLIVFRFANSMFERVWNRDAIENVQLTVAETLGVEGRGAYYDSAGAIRDIVQNHLLQMLAFLAMEPPRSLDPAAIHDEKVKVLQAVRAFSPENVVRGQYERGTIDGERVPGYTSEDGVPTDSNTETFAAIKARIDNWRWQGIPFLLRTGKRLARPRSPSSSATRPRICSTPRRTRTICRSASSRKRARRSRSKRRNPDRDSTRRRFGWTSATRSSSTPRPPTRTSACCTTRCAATIRCSRARTMSRKRGALSIRS